jgi:hypothetical protein
MKITKWLVPVTLSVVLAGCAVDMPDLSRLSKLSFPGFRSTERFKSEPDFNRLIVANKGRRIAYQNRLQVLGYLLNPALRSSGDYRDWVNDYEDKLQALGCKQTSDSRIVDGQALVADNGKWCISQSASAAEKYVVKLYRNGDGERQLFYATVVYSNSANVEMHLAGLPSIETKNGKLYKTRWAAIMSRGNTFVFLPVGRFEGERKAQQTSDTDGAAAPASGGKPDEGFDLDSHLDILNTL